MTDQELQELTELRQEVARLKAIEAKYTALTQKTNGKPTAASVLPAKPDGQPAQNYRTILEIVPIPMFVSRLSDGLITYANSSAGELVGIAAEELLGRSTPDFYFDPDDRQFVLDAVRRDGHLYQHELHLKRADGTEFWALASLQVMEFQGEPSLYAGLYDITDRKFGETNLRRSETQLRAILNAMPDLIFSVRRDGTVVDLRGGHDAILYKTEAEIVGKKIPDILPPDLARQRLNYLEQAFQTGELQFFEFDIETNNGLRHEEGRFIVASPDEAVHIVRDVTDRARAEAALAKRATALEAVARVSAAVSSILDADQLLQQVANLTRDQFGLYHAHIYLLNHAGDALDLAAGAGDVGANMVAQGWSIPLYNKKSLVAQAARSRKGVIVNNVREEPGWLPNELLPATRAEMAVPMIVGDVVLGVLDVQSDQLDYFTAEDVSIQTTLAAQIGIALQNAATFARQQETGWQLQERVKELDCLNDIGRKIVDSPHISDFLGWVVRRIPQAMQHPEICVAALEYDGQLFGNPAVLEMPAKIVDEMRVTGQVAGRIHIAYTEPRPFLDEEIAMLGGIASRVGGYIENQRLFDQALDSLAQVEQSRHFLRTLIDNIPNPIFYKDVNGAYMGFNRAFLEYLGKTEEELIGKTVYDLDTDKELADRYHEADMALFRKPGVHVYEAAVKYADGTLRDVIFNKATFVNPDGSLGGLVGAMVDITERKRIEEALRENEVRYRSLFEDSPVALWEEDISEVYAYFNRLRAEGVTDFRDYFQNHPEAVYHATSLIKVLDVNQATLKMLKAETKEELFAALPQVFGDASFDVLLDEMVTVAEGGLSYQNEIPHRTLTGETIIVKHAVTVVPGYDHSLSRALITSTDITERKQAEGIIRRSEADLSQALKIAKLAYWEYDVEKDLFTFNDQFYALFHTTADQHGGYQLPSAYYAEHFVYPDDLPIVGTEIERALNSTDRHYSRLLEHRIVYADGGIGYFSVNINLERDEYGKILRYYGANQDITERKQAEEELRQLSRAVEQSASTVVITDTKGYIEYANPRFTETTGYTVEEALGQHTRILKSGETSDEEYKAMWETITAGSEWRGQFLNKKKNGELYWESANISPIKDVKGEITHFLAVKEEITERKEAEAERERLLAEMQQSQELLRSVIDATPDWIFVKDQEHRYRMINQGYADALRINPEDVIGKNDLELGFPEELVKGNPEKGIRGFWTDDRLVMASGQMQVYPDDPATIDGVVHTFHTIKTPLRDPDGQVWGVLAFARDITERKQAEAERERLLDEVQAAYRQYVRREWEQYLADKHQGAWQVEVTQPGIKPAEPAQTALQVPIALRGQSIGTLSLHDVAGDRTWTEDEKALIATVTEQLALTVENLRLFENTRQRAVREQLTREITDKMRAAPNVDSIIQTGLSELARQLGVSRTYVKLNPDSSPDKQP